MSKVANTFKNLSPSLVKSVPSADYSEQPDAIYDFDRRYGVDTGGIIPLSHLDIENKTWVYGVRYQPIHCIDFCKLLQPLNLDFGQHVFVDLGSGKGRAILLASMLPFKRIVGVEFSRDLVRVAEANIRRFPSESRKCDDIDLVCMDATVYEFPCEPLALFMYNPFERPIMTRVIKNLAASFRERPRRIVVLYFKPVCSDLWDCLEFLERVDSVDGLSLYDTPAAMRPF